MPRSFSVRLRVPVIWVALGLFVPAELLLLWAYRWAGADWKEVIVFGATVIGGAFALFSHLRSVDEKLLERADHLVQRWSSPELEAHKTIMAQVYSGELTPRDFAVRREASGKIVLPGDVQTRRKIMGLLDYAEAVSLAANKRTADEETLRLMLEDVVVKLWIRFQPWIEAEREADQQTPDHENAYYRQLELAAGRWSRRV